jgi:hypothetical protein
MLSRLRIYLSRMFEPYLYTAEGFRITKQKYVVPEETISLPAVKKRAITICNLLANEHKSIDEIAALLDTSRSSVISALIQEGLVLDRRGLNRYPKIEKRQAVKYHLPLVLSTGQTDKFRALCGGRFGSETVSEFVFNEVLKKEERCEECLKRSTAGN